MKPKQKTDIRVLYNDKGFYVGGMLYDEHPDSIQMELTEGDDLGNTGWIAIFLDPYNSGQNGFAFFTTPANVQFDSQYSTDGEDGNWDAVWQSKSILRDNGWSVEYFIPFSAIRFPKTGVQSWTINFVRRVQRNPEKSFWTAIDPNIDGYPQPVWHAHRHSGCKPSGSDSGNLLLGGRPDLPLAVCAG